ncbi:MAG TPA: hypothetical protein VN442_17450 [Bryobacteraceae bacterium]|nr:hypothetical protein [Bryobacteraceae bacterium]
MGWRILLGLLPVFSLFGAGDTPLDRSTLRGLKSFSVVVDRLDPELEGAGVTRDNLQARLTRRMETADITVDAKAPEFLGLRLMHVRRRRGPYAVCLTLAVYQPVTLVRDRQVKTATQTWELQTVLITDPKGLTDAIIRATDELLDGFVTAYRSTTPAGAATETAPSK